LPGAALLMGAFLLHFFLSLFSLYSRSTLRMPLWEGTQITLGVLIFPLILVHIVGTQGAGHIIGFRPTYEYVIFTIWVSNPILGLQQSIMLVIVWAICVWVCTTGFGSGTGILVGLPFSSGARLFCR